MSEEGELPLVRRSGKSETAFRTISEVAEELDVPQHVLRFWESKFSQVRPLKRGGGRRYYRPEDVALLLRIRDLLYSEGYTIKGVQKLLREGGHKDAVSTRSEAEPGLPLSEDSGAGAILELSEINDGEEDDGDSANEAIQVSARPGEARFSAQDRLDLEEILAELENLRGLLQPR